MFQFPLFVSSEAKAAEENEADVCALEMDEFRLQIEKRRNDGEKRKPD